jgi:phosphopantetheinyl transferase
MFRYALVHTSEQPSLALGQAWPGLLSPREEAIFAGFAFLPRRCKWLLGRAAAKRLVREISGQPAMAETSISVLNRPSGEPFVLIEGQGEWEYPISISHRSEVGMAAAPERRHARIGADIETIEPRDLALARQFFTNGEAEIVAASGRDCDETVARIWSAKEAVLKLLGLGLRLDTRGVVVNLVGEPFRECPAGWQPIEVKGRADLPGVDPPKSLRVVWRREGGHVLTVAVED